MPTKKQVNVQPKNTLTWEEFQKLEEPATAYFQAGFRRGAPIKQLFALGCDTKVEIAQKVQAIRAAGFDIFFAKNANQASYSDLDHIHAVKPNADWRKLMCLVGKLKPDEVYEEGTTGVTLWWD